MLRTCLEAQIDPVWGEPALSGPEELPRLLPDVLTAWVRAGPGHPLPVTSTLVLPLWRKGVPGRDQAHTARSGRSLGLKVWA